MSTRAGRRGGRTIKVMSDTQQPVYSPVESVTWHEEGGIPVPAWRVTVDHPGGYRTNYYFQTESGAERFFRERLAG
jgi:hypothetical protein